MRTLEDLQGELYCIEQQLVFFASGMVNPETGAACVALVQDTLLATAEHVGRIVEDVGILVDELAKEGRA